MTGSNPVLARFYTAGRRAPSSWAGRWGPTGPICTVRLRRCLLLPIRQAAQKQHLERRAESHSRRWAHTPWRTPRLQFASIPALGAAFTSQLDILLHRWHPTAMGPKIQLLSHRYAAGDSAGGCSSRHGSVSNVVDTTQMPD